MANRTAGDKIHIQFKNEFVSAVYVLNEYLKYDYRYGALVIKEYNTVEYIDVDNIAKMSAETKNNEIAPQEATIEEV